MLIITRRVKLLVGLLLWLAAGRTSWSFYNPTTGRWLSRDPIEELGGKNLYTFVDNDPIAGIDLYGLITVKQSLAKICKLHDETGRLAEQLKQQNPSDVRLLFVDTQVCILKKLCNGVCCVDTDEAGDWLSRTVNLFISSLNNALKGQIAPNTGQGFQEFINTTKGGSWWSLAFEAIENAPRKLKQGSGLQPTYAEAAAAIMARFHINYDLFFALQLQGVGGESDWKCIGKVVSECAKQTSPRPAILLDLAPYLTPNIDPTVLRDAMRNRLILELEKQGQHPRQNPYRGALPQ